MFFLKPENTPTILPLTGHLRIVCRIKNTFHDCMEYILLVQNIRAGTGPWRLGEKWDTCREEMG